MNKYKVIETCTTVEEFLNLRIKAGLNPKTVEGATIGLPNTWYGVHIRDGEKAIGMGRIVGDGGTVFVVSDIAVLPEYQGQGLGRVIMETLMKYYKANAPKSSYLSLIADGDAKFLYKKFEFYEVAPASVGMGFKL